MNKEVEQNLKSKDFQEQLGLRGKELLESLYAFTKSSSTALMIWDRLLTLSEKNQFGNPNEGPTEEFEKRYRDKGTIGLWIELRSGTQIQAMIDISYELGYLSEPDMRLLLWKTGEAESNIHESQIDHPVWDRSKGQLRFHGKVIRKIRCMGEATNIQRIVDAFHDKNWKIEIPTPRLLSLDPRTVHEAIRSLNSGMNSNVIKFHARNGGLAIYWEHSSTQ